MSEQAKFQAWWDECGFNSVILRAAAWTAWMARAELKEPLPTANQCAACDAPAEPGTVGCKDCNEYATAICSPEPEPRNRDEALKQLVEEGQKLGMYDQQPVKTRVRLWSCDTDGVVVAEDNCPAPGWIEIHHDAEGFYVEGQR